jgi:predicted RNase H-like HicB family nuclease
MYTVRARRSASWWAIDVPELPGVYTQARRLDRVTDIAREAIALYLDADPATVEVRLAANLPADLEREVKGAASLRVEAERLQAESSAATRRVIADLLGRGLTVRDAAIILGISHQRVAQLAGGRQAESRRR